MGKWRIRRVRKMILLHMGNNASVARQSACGSRFADAASPAAPAQSSAPQQVAVETSARWSQSPAQLPSTQNSDRYPAAARRRTENTHPQGADPRDRRASAPAETLPDRRRIAHRAASPIEKKSSSSRPENRPRQSWTVPRKCAPKYTLADTAAALRSQLRASTAAAQGPQCRARARRERPEALRAAVLRRPGFY